MAWPQHHASARATANGASSQPKGAVDDVCQGCEENNWTATELIDESSGEPVPGIPYKIFDVGTKEEVASGILDENGQSIVHPIAMKHTNLFVMYGTDGAIDEAMDEIERLQKEQALAANARNNWRGIPAGLSESEFNDAYDRRTWENGGRFEKPTVGFFEGAGYGAIMAYDYVFSGFDSDHMIEELYKADRARSFDEYQLVTGAREATKWESFSGGTGQGLSFGFGEEGMAWLDSAITGRDYDEILADRRQLLKAEELSNSGYYLGGEITGGVATIFIPVAGAAGKAAQGANAGSKVIAGAKASAKVGAGLGALSGAGHDEGGVVDRLDGALLGAATGGVAGLLLGGAGVLLARGASRLRIPGRVRFRGRNNSVKGAVDDANFAQNSIRSDRAFSDEGQAVYSKLAGKEIKTVDDLSAALKNGDIKVSDVPVDYVTIDGNKLILNTRTSTALQDAGIPRSQWFATDRTGQTAYGNKLFDDLARDQLRRNDLPSSGSPTIGN